APARASARRCCAMARRWARRSRSPTTFSTPRRPRSNLASAPARTPSATRALSSPSTVLTAPKACATRLLARPSPRLARPALAAKAISCARRRASSPRAPTKGERHERVQLGRSVRPRNPTHRRRADGAEDRLRLRQGPAGAARAGGVPAGEDRRRHLPRDGRAWLPRADGVARLRRLGPRLCRLRADRARGRERRFRLSLDDVGAILAGHDPDRDVRLARPEG